MYRHVLGRVLLNVLWDYKIAPGVHGVVAHKMSGWAGIVFTII